MRDWSRQLFAAIGDGIEGSPQRKWATIQSVWGEISGKEVELEIRRHDEAALEIDVTSCRFAEFFRALGEPELGALLICEADFDIASVGEGEVSLEPRPDDHAGRPELHLPLQVRAPVVVSARSPLATLRRSTAEASPKWDERFGIVGTRGQADSEPAEIKVVGSAIGSRASPHAFGFGGAQRRFDHAGDNELRVIKFGERLSG